MNKNKSTSDKLLQNYKNIIKNGKNVNKKGIIASKESNKIGSRNFDIIDSDKNSKNYKLSIEKIDADNVSQHSSAISNNLSIDKDIVKNEKNKKIITKFKNGVNKIIKIKRYVNFFKPKNNEKDPFYIFNPDHKFDKFFQILIMIFIFLSVTIIPFKIAFYFDDYILFYEVLEYFTEAFFIIDLIKNFFTAYYDEHKILVKDLKSIVLNYLRGWFAIDLISSIPFKLLRLDSASFTKITKLPRIIKFIKLAKILRILKFIKDKKKFDKIISKISKLKNGYERMFGSIFMAFIIFHTISCFWFIVGNLTKPNWIDERGIQFLSVGEQYLICLYWTIQTVFTVGYGDYGPINSTERIMATIIMFIGVFIYSFVIGNISSIYNIINNQDHIYNEKLEILNSILKNNTHINNKRFINKIKNHIKNFNTFDQKIDEFLNELPFKNKMDISVAINKFKVKNITYFNDKSDSFLYEIGNNWNLITYKKDEQIYAKNENAIEIYFIKKGSVDFYYNSNNIYEKILTIKEGFYFGELDIFYYDSKRFFEARAAEKCELLILKFQIWDDIFFKQFIDCGEIMINDSKIRKDRIETELIKRNFIKKKNNASIENMSKIEEINEDYSNEDSIKKPNNFLNPFNESKNMDKKRGSLFFNKFKNFQNLQKKNNSKKSIHNSERNFQNFNKFLNEKKKNNKSEILSYALNIEMLTNKYEQIAEKYSYLLFNELKKGRRKKTNLLTLNYQTLNKYIEHEKEIEFDSKLDILNLQKKIKDLKIQSIMNLK